MTTDDRNTTAASESAHLLALFIAAYKTGGSYDLDIVAANAESVLAEHRQMREAIRVAHQALSRQQASCRWHGAEFDEVDTWLGVPRCESCRGPYRVVRALKAIAALEPSLVGDWQPAGDDT